MQSVTAMLSDQDMIPISPPPPRILDNDPMEVDSYHTSRNDFTLPPIDQKQLRSPRNGRVYFSPNKEKLNNKKYLKSPKKSKLRTSMASSLRTNTPDDAYPECIPFQSQNFMSSTKLKKVHIAKRHLDTFGGSEYSIPFKRGMILHTDRYSWEGARPVEGTVSQRDRLRLEIDYIEKLRGLKKRKEVWPHRMDIDLLMAGKSIEFEERFDLNGELQHLKSLVLPEMAKDLYHGKGIRLPPTHASLKPRSKRMFGGVDGGTASAPSMLNPSFSLDPDIRQGWPTMSPSGRSGLLPSLGDPKQGRLGRKPSHPPSSILPQATPSQLPKLELHPSRSYAPSSETPLNSREPTFKKNSTLKNSPLHDEISLDNSPPDPPSMEPPDEHDSVGQVKEDCPQEPPSEVNSPANDITGEMETLDSKEHATTTDDDTDMKDYNETFLTTHREPDLKPTVNPLQGTDVNSLLDDNTRTELTETFQKLDENNSGHLHFDQLQSHLPVATHEEMYLKKVYELSSLQTGFGVDEFMTMNLLTKAIGELSGPPADAFTTMDVDTVGDLVLKYSELFESVDRSKHGFISLSSLKEILSTQLDISSNDLWWTNVLQDISKTENDKLSKMEYISLIPYFQKLSTHVLIHSLPVTMATSQYC